MAFGQIDPSTSISSIIGTFQDPGGAATRAIDDIVQQYKPESWKVGLGTVVFMLAFGFFAWYGAGGAEWLYGKMSEDADAPDDADADPDEE